jgi:hypothetical protein
MIVALAAACSKGGAGGADPCAQAYAKASSLGAMGGQGYGDSAVIFGTACPDLKKDDFACIAKATTVDQLKACDHAGKVIKARFNAMKGSHHGSGQPDPKVGAALREVADAVCACKDSACLVAVGQQHRAAIDAVTNGEPPHDDKAAMEVAKRMGGCFDAIVKNDRARIDKAGSGGSGSAAK